MVDVIRYRDSGIEVLDLDTEAHEEYAEQIEEGVATVTPFRLPTKMDATIEEMDESEVLYRGRYFVAVSLLDDEPDEMAKEMLGVEEIDEAVVMAATSDGDNVAVLHHEEGAGISDMIEYVETDVMPETGVTTDVGGPDVSDFGDDEAESSDETDTDESQEGSA
jgi:hypothetical protein